MALSLTETWNRRDTPTATNCETFAEPDPNLSNGRFTSLVKVGVGGFGTVYKAFDTELQRTVALKVPHTSRMQNGAGRERFVREARHLAQLRHPSIVPIYDVSAESDRLVLITEYLEGETLAATLRRRRLRPDQAAGLCIKLAEAIHHAHENGIVHRDVKPGNVIVNQGGNPFLMDFGLAKDETTDNTLSIEGQLLGTPSYMSPEQALGSLTNVDRRSDVYSLGVVLYEMLSSERPFRGEPHLLMYQVLHNEPPRPRSLNDQISYDLEMVCLQAMSKQQQVRYPICALRPTGVHGVTRPIRNSKWFDLVSAVVRGETVQCTGGGKEVHAADVAKAVGILLTAGRIVGEAFNYYDRYVSELDVATLAKKLSGSKSQIIGDSSPNGRRTGSRRGKPRRRSYPIKRLG